jgi:hypothetical protein
MTAMAINPAFRGHGTYCYMPDEIERYFKTYPNGFQTGSSVIERVGSFFGVNRAPVTGVVGAFRDMGMSHAWVRLFGLEGAMPETPTRKLIDKLAAAGIHVAGWGYCHGRNAQREQARAIELSSKYGLSAFIADIEPGRELGGTKSKWDEREFDAFVGELSKHFAVSNFGISTWPVLKIQNDPQFPSLKLMRIAADRVAMFAPQAYWMSYPKQVHYDATGFKRADYPPDDPASFVRLVTDSWRDTGFRNPLVLTGQAYWGENAPPQDVLERKITAFVADYADWPKIDGFNWWHAGGNAHAMSAKMIAAIAAGKLGEKPFRSESLPIG